jgi:hypothetical protein
VGTFLSGWAEYRRKAVQKGADLQGCPANRTSIAHSGLLVRVSGHVRTVQGIRRVNRGYGRNRSGHRLQGLYDLGPANRGILGEKLERNREKIGGTPSETPGGSPGCGRLENPSSRGPMWAQAQGGGPSVSGALIEIARVRLNGREMPCREDDPTPRVSPQFGSGRPFGLSVRVI